MDASRLLYRRNRYYDPTTGRFTQEDPIGFAGGINLYGFAGGDPVNFADPFGLKVEFRDDEHERMRWWWQWGKSVLSARAERGDRRARFLLRSVERIEADPDVIYTFEKGAVPGLGSVMPGSRRMTIDVDDIVDGGDGQVEMFNAMIHEFGHAYYGQTRGRFGHDTETSNWYGEDFEETYRGAMGYCRRRGHNPYPAWGCSR